MVDVLRLHNVGERDEAQPAYVRAVEGSVVGSRVVFVGVRTHVFHPHARRCLCASHARNCHRCRLVGGVHDDLNRVWVEHVVCDGLGRRIKHGWYVVFGLDVGRDGRRRRDLHGSLLYIALEYLRSRW